MLTSAPNNLHHVPHHARHHALPAPLLLIQPHVQRHNLLLDRPPFFKVIHHPDTLCHPLQNPHLTPFTPIPPILSTLAHGDELKKEGRSLCAAIYKGGATNGGWLIPNNWALNVMGWDFYAITNGCPYQYFKVCYGRHTVYHNVQLLLGLCKAARVDVFSYYHLFPPLLSPSPLHPLFPPLIISPSSSSSFPPLLTPRRIARLLDPPTSQASPNNPPPSLPPSPPTPRLSLQVTLHFQHHSLQANPLYPHHSLQVNPASPPRSRVSNHRMNLRRNPAHNLLNNPHRSLLHSPVNNQHQNLPCR